MPSPDSFLEVAELPALGAGKLDIRQIKHLAETAFAATLHDKM